MALQAERMACKKVVGILVFRIWQIIHYSQIMECVYVESVMLICNKMKEGKRCWCCRNLNLGGPQFTHDL